MAFIVPVVAFRTLLVTNAAIIAHFAPDAPRIYGTPGIPRAEVQSMPRAAVTLLQLGGAQNRNIPIGTVTIAMKCYGAQNTLEAMDLYSVIDEVLGDMAAPVAGRRLQNQQVPYGAGNCYIYTIHKSTGPMDVMEPVETWPYVWSSYMMMYWQRVVA